jgi:hypothetical protein
MATNLFVEAMSFNSSWQSVSWQDPYTNEIKEADGELYSSDYRDRTYYHKNDDGTFDVREWFEEGITHVEVYRDYQDAEAFTGEYIVVAPYKMEE